MVLIIYSLLVIRNLYLEVTNDDDDDDDKKDDDHENVTETKVSTSNM